MNAELVVESGWVEEVRAILRDADGTAWRAERAEELRRRVRSVVEAARARFADATTPTPSVARARALVATMDVALPVEGTRARWTAFVRAVHPTYQALLDALPASAAPATVRPTNYARSLFHFTAAFVALAIVTVVPSHRVVTGIALAFAVYAWSMEIGRRRSPRMNAWLMKMYGRVAHPHEWTQVNSATWYATALVFLALFTTRHATMASLAVLGVADPVAAFVGRRWGSHRLRAGRSLEGTLAFVASGFVVAAVALVVAGGLSPLAVVGYALLAAVAGAVAELVATRLDDNLTIPVAVGATVTIVSTMIS